MIRTASRDDLPALRELFARANDAPYDLVRVAEEKCFGAGIAGEPLCRVVEEGGRMAGAAVTCGKWVRIVAVDREKRRRGIGRALLADAEAQGAGAIGAEAGNYFTPGVWEGDEGTRACLSTLGYIPGAETWNLEVALQDIDEVTQHGIEQVTQPRSVEVAQHGAVEMPQPRSIEVTPPGIEEPSRAVRTTHQNAAAVLEFIQREFGRIWRFEAEKAFLRDTLPLFHTESNGQITGFVAHDVNNAGLGFFGPTGVARALRGRGLGRTLLLASLADLRRMGYERAIIPWTDALAFYEKSCGAQPAARFITYEKPRA